MAQSNADVGPEVAPAGSDLRTAAHLGRRVAEAAARWRERRVGALLASERTRCGVSVAFADAAAALDELRDLLGRYFDGLYRSDSGLLATVFHPAAVYATATEGTLTRLSMAEYLPIVAARRVAGVAGRGPHRRDRIDRVRRAGDRVGRGCSARSVRSSSPTCSRWCRSSGRWQIIAKVFHFDLDRRRKCDMPYVNIKITREGATSTQKAA